MPTYAPSPFLMKHPVRTSHAGTVILADDLTGACDAAAPFLGAGHSARVWLGDKVLHAAGESVFAFNTDSRGLAPEQAAAAVAKAAAAIEPTPGRLLFKKVDSAGRGNIAAEVLAAHFAFGTRAVLFAPSFPAAGRTVQNGILRVEDVSGVSHLPLMQLFEDKALAASISRPDEISGSLSRGLTVLVCDASRQEDLDAFASLEIPGLLYAGSAGLATALAQRHRNPLPGPPRPLPVAERVVTLCGTTHPVSQGQTSRLNASHPGHPCLQIRLEAREVERIFNEFSPRRPDAVILTGGDTALFVLRTLHALSIRLCGELAPGIPWGIVHGGIADGLIVVTKSGGFGTPDALTQILHTLTGTT